MAAVIGVKVIKSILCYKQTGSSRGPGI